MKNIISDKARAKIDEVIDRFQRGDLGEVLELARIKRHPDDSTPSSNWTLANLLLAFFSTGSLDCRGYRQWQAVGRQVRKGERSGCILVPLHKTVDDENRPGEKIKILVGFKAVAVFGLEQTDGDDLPTFDYAPAELPPLYDVAQALGVKVEFCPLPPDRNADVDPEGQHIRVGTQDHKPFWHELAHAIHARIQGRLKAGQDALQETVAEFTACILSLLYGHKDYTGNAWEYISRYNNDPLGAIMQALGTVEQVVAEIEAVKATL